MCRCLVIQHVQSDQMASVIEAVLTQHCSNWTYYWLDFKNPQSLKALEQQAADYSHLLLLGGIEQNKSAARLKGLSTYINFLSAWQKEQKAVLGICLGGQLLARSWGWPLVPLTQSEKGWESLSLLPSEMKPSATPSWFYWRSRRFSLASLETKDWVLAANSSGQPAILHPPKSKTFAFSGHPELKLETAKGWIHQSKSLNTSEKQAFLKQTEQQLEASHQWFSHWLTEFLT